MNLIPDLKKIKEIAKTGDYTVITVSTQILSDFITPIEALRILKNASDHVYMLESAKADETWGRYTFLGFEPKMLITCKDGVFTAGDKTIKTNDPSGEIRKIMAEYKSPKVDELNFFTGGLVGYFSFEYFGYSEPSIRCDLEDENEFKDVDLMLFDKVIAFDNLSQKIYLIANIKLNDIDNEYERAGHELERIADLLRNGEKKKEPASRLKGDIKPLFDTYRELRTINPSPYMFYFSGTDVEVAGASPETLVKLKDGILHTFPLAGTRKRGATPKEDEDLEAELLKDEKELAEHNMLVDLGRNDLGRISEFGSVAVEKLRSIERFSHVMHIGSTVRGKIRDDKDALSAIEAVMPAGTLSGAPKIRACELIGQLEGNKRGIYGGAIGYIDFNGNMDTCIAIRLVYRKGDTVFVRSGAGIVADSVPELEFEECMNKARASLRALESSSQGDEL